MNILFICNQNQNRSKTAADMFKGKYETKHRLYLAGVYGGEYYEGIKKYINEKGFDDDIIFGGFVGNDDVYRLYKNTDALIFCTLKEGFGMPVIEAMDLGVPGVFGVCLSGQPLRGALSRSFWIPAAALGALSRVSRLASEMGLGPRICACVAGKSIRGQSKASRLGMLLPAD